eukprot:TRINITY_DN24515_c0_g1_i1.p1 TRINITY_DN24515_c0_g1~~TRINITY_DN24515_c0_g1_i1.p1  ORF type:complete len:779 (+),score=92.39 TRINITY_DN24515_c0_g1_i1:30-2366(+)
MSVAMPAEVRNGRRPNLQVVTPLPVLDEDSRPSDKERMHGDAWAGVGQTGKYHRHSVFASLFEIRAAVPADEAGRLLQRKDTHRNYHTTTKLSCKEKVCERLAEVLSLEWPVKLLSLFSVLLAPFLLAFEASCEQPSERLFAAVLKYVHFVCSIIYLVFATYQAVVTETLSPWRHAVGLSGPSIQQLTQTKSLHPQILEQLSSPTRTHMNHAPSLAPTMSFRDVRAWTPIVDLIVLAAMVAETVHLTERPERGPTAAQWVYLLSATKGFRFLLPSTSNVVSKLWWDMLCLCASLSVFIHLCLCLMSTIAIIELNSGTSDSWVGAVLENGEARSCRKFYMFSLYFTATTVTSIGYGDVTPLNNAERLTTSLIMVCSQLYLAKVFADLTFITTMYNQWTMQRYQRRTQTRSAMQNMNVPRSVIERVEACQTYMWEVQKAKRAKECFEDLTAQLREEVQLVMYHRLVLQIPFLQTVSLKALRYIISSLSDSVFLPSDFMISRGDTGHEMYFLREGYGGVFVSYKAPHWDDVEIKTVSAGGYFGEVALLTGQLRTAWIMARTYCMASVLHQNAIESIMAEDPSCICALIKDFQKMLDLKPTLTWRAVGLRLQTEFGEDVGTRSDDLYDFTCSGKDGLAPAGLITWTRYRLLLSRIQVCDLDQKLLWTSLDVEMAGSVTFDHFLSTIFENDSPKPWSESSKGAASRSFKHCRMGSSGGIALSADIQRLEHKLDALGTKLDSWGCWMSSALREILAKQGSSAPPLQVDEHKQLQTDVTRPAELR